MERSRSKRYYYDQDYESETLHSRSKPRYGSNSHGGGGGHHYAPSYRRSSSSGGGGGRKLPEQVMGTTNYRILCHDVKAGGVIGKSGSIIKAIRQNTGAWINVHELAPGDEERIIEISDNRGRSSGGRLPSFSPAQEALLMIHERILETDGEGGGYGHSDGFVEDENDVFGGRGGGGGGNRVVTRLVVSRMHVGCLMGKGGKIIEQMRMETNTHIRILPRDHTLPRCVSMSEEIVQVVGDMNAVKSALEIISSRLRESQHRDRSHFHNRVQSPDRFYPPDDDFHVNNRQSSAEGPSFGSRYSGGSMNNNYSSCSSGFSHESRPASVSDNARSFPGEELVFRILCPVRKVDFVVGESDGVIDLLHNEIGVNIDVSDPVAGLDELIIIISSDEGPDDELFPAQEALLHIQTRIVDLVPEKENIVTTRLLLQSDEIGSLADLGKISGVSVEILPREQRPVGVSGMDEIVQIVGEITAAREALVEVTARIRSYIYREFHEKDEPVSRISAPSPVNGGVEPEAASRNNAPQYVEMHAGNGYALSTPHSFSTTTTSQKVKDVASTPSNADPVKQNESERREDHQPSILNRISSVPLVTRSILEVVLPPHAASELAKKSRKLTLISELSGATMKLVDDGPEATEKVIQISGTPEQAERAQSLLQGFILSTEDG
ncbi:RNA-binding KH domain-containing protein RCF3-like isoform X1 [Salvia splendens]|uniref:RNA-binding KH domain-containing protein RCF3-like isoform X1 n=1 Tax=Salvia splendens TaxID=180675 RepID=UPI001C265206|nr:RNA-binding KH domain-containing protein RCF3-like isoform X1 [Salvia splendens]